ncbi:hypothetical protein D3C78_1287400 [compost metagenome]
MHIELGKILLTDIFRAASIANNTAFQPDSVIAKRSYRSKIVAYKKNRAPLLKLSQETHALLRKESVTNRQRLIDNQNISIDMSNNGERQTSLHPTGIGLYGLLDEISQLREINDFLKAFFNAGLLQLEQAGVQVDIFAPTELRIKPRTQL